MPAYPQFRRSISLMKKQKNAVTGQLTSAEKLSLVRCLKGTHANFFENFVPWAPNAEYVAVGSTPYPRTIEQEIQDWADIIHGEGGGANFSPCASRKRSALGNPEEDWCKKAGNRLSSRGARWRSQLLV